MVRRPARELVAGNGNPRDPARKRKHRGHRSGAPYKVVGYINGQNLLVDGGLVRGL